MDNNINLASGDTVSKEEEGNFIADESNKKGSKSKKSRNFWRKQKQQAQCLKIIDRRYKQRKEVLPGIIVYSNALVGEIKLDIRFQAELIHLVLNRALTFWAHTVGYTEIRSLKGLNGQSSSTSDLEAIKETSNRLTISIWVMLRQCLINKNFGHTLMEKGYTSIQLPKFVFELLSLTYSYNRLHQHQFLEKSAIKLTVKSFDRFSLFRNWEKDLDNDFVKTQEKFCKWDDDIDEAYNYLSRFTAVSNFMQSQSMDIYEFSTHLSPHTLNVIAKSCTSTTYDMILGQNATEKDTALSSFVTPIINENCLTSGQLHTYNYPLPTKQLVNALKRFLLREYVGIDDNFVAPVTTSVEAEIISGAKDSTDTIV